MINRNACAALAAAVVLAAVLLPSASATEREDLLQEVVEKMRCLPVCVPRARKEPTPLIDPQHA